LKRKYKRKLKGQKIYKNTHGIIYRVKTKPNYRVTKNNPITVNQKVEEKQNT